MEEILQKREHRPVDPDIAGKFKEKCAVTEDPLLHLGKSAARVSEDMGIISHDAGDPSAPHVLHDPFQAVFGNPVRLIQEQIVPLLIFPKTVVSAYEDIFEPFVQDYMAFLKISSGKEKHPLLFGKSHGKVE